MRSSTARVAKRVLAGLATVVAAVVCILVAAIVVLTNSAWGHEQVKRIAISAMRGPVHGIVDIGGIEGDLLTHVVVTNLSIRDSSGAPFISVQRAEVRYSLIDFLKKRLAFTDVHADRPLVVLVQSQDGEWN